MDASSDLGQPFLRRQKIYKKIGGFGLGKEQVSRYIQVKSIRFNVHIQSKLLQRTIIVGASSDLGQPFRP